MHLSKGLWKFSTASRNGSPLECDLLTLTVRSSIQTHVLKQLLSALNMYQYNTGHFLLELSFGLQLFNVPLLGLGEEYKV